jgi:hypothetical protein
MQFGKVDLTLWLQQWPKVQPWKMSMNSTSSTTVTGSGMINVH